MLVPADHADSRAIGPRIIDAAPAAATELTPLQVALRYKWLIALFALAMAGAVYGLLNFVTATYSAEADVRIDMPQVRAIDSGSSVLSSETVSLELVHTEMAVLNSPALAARAAQSLGLTELPEYQDCDPVPFKARVLAFVDMVRGRDVPGPQGCVVSSDTAAKVLLGQLTFANDRVSYIISITAAAPNAAMASKIANGYARAYVDWQRELKGSLAQEADDWLSTELAAIHDRMIAADGAVETYRQTHHLIGVHGTSDTGPSETVSTQRLGALNTELTNVAATLVDKSTQLAQVQQALKNGKVEDIGPAMESPIVQSLLTKHGELIAALAELRANYGSNYPNVAAAAASLSRNEAQIRIEAERALANLKGQVAALTARHDAIEAQVGHLGNDVAGESSASVKLAELEREATTDRTLYESLFVRLKQVDAERRLERANAAVVVEALPPDFPTFPKKKMMVAGAFLASLGIGTGLAFAREMMSRRFRDADQIEGEIGLPVIGMFPKRNRAPQDIVIDQPMSLEAEAVHATLTQLLGQPGQTGAGGGKTVLVTSALPGEGKSCFSVGLGRSAMRAGLSAFVLDCDLRRPSVERLMGGGRGPKAALKGSQDPAELITEMMQRAGVDERSGLRFLSVGDYVKNPHGLLAWPGLPATLKYLRSRYDLVIIDSPPVLATSDALKLGGLSDEVVLMINWKETPRQAVAAAVRALQRARVDVTGAVMAKVDLRSYARASGNESFYVRNYHGYGQDVVDVN